MSDQRPPAAPHELSPEDQQSLLNANTESVAAIEQLGDPWEDDHEVCTAVRVHTDRPIDVSLWWCGPEIVGAVQYCDESPRAMGDVLTVIQQDIKNNQG
jgi:hypothetical protein